MSPTHETRLDDGRGNHRRGSSCWLPRDEAPKQSVRTSGIYLAIPSGEASCLIAEADFRLFRSLGTLR